MRIIEKGRVKNIRYFAYCDSCGCKAELTEAEYDNVPVRSGYYGTMNRDILCVTENCTKLMHVYCEIL